MKTRICRLHQAHDIRIETQSVPEPGPGQVRVGIGAGGICGSDLHYYHDGGFGPIRVREPIILGHEVAGIVESTGPNVGKVHSGDRVAVNPSRPCGHCEYCTQDLPQHCLDMRFFGSAMRFPHEQGAFRDYILVDEGQCVKVSPKTDLGQLACSEPLAVGLHATNVAGDLTGKKVLITGAGPIGSLCTAAVRHAGAGEIVVSDIHDATLMAATEMGAARVINSSRDPQALADYAAGKGYFDAVFECSAAAPALHSALSAIRPQGVFVQLGVAGDVPVPLNLIVGKEVRMMGSFRFHSEFADAARLIESGEIDVRPIISGTYPVEQALEAFRQAADRSTSVKVQLTFAAGGA
ncbi:MAG: L-idonate 5-dehydrogenase [Hyphomicrobiales bacterium]|nr:MAG: L-idonate 5-dehydrogenase [Hyphomicrobiales bacterium]